MQCIFCNRIELVKIRATEQVAILFDAEIRVNFFDIFGCARHNSNKFGFALACTKIRVIRGQKNNTWFLFFHPTDIYLQKYVFCAIKGSFSLFAYKKSSSFVDIHP